MCVRDEFVIVYNKIFSDDSTTECKQYACDVMTVWRLRRQNLTPASVLSTLAILEVQLKDRPDTANITQLNELRTLYSNAFTR